MLRLRFAQCSVVREKLNADKCVDAFGQPTFGETYLTANGARANIHLGQSGDYLIPQNWVNARRGYCAMFPQ